MIMKLSIVCASLAVLFIGCVSNSLPLEDEEDSREDDTVEKESGPPMTGDGHGSLCDLYQGTTKTIDGLDVTIEIPVMCDPNPLIHKGDPPPDRLNPAGDREQVENPSDQNHIMNPDSDNLI